MAGIDHFIDPYRLYMLGSLRQPRKQPANQYRDGCLHSSGFSTEKLTVCQITTRARYLLVSEIADTLVYVFGRLGPSRKENKGTLTLYNWPLM